MQATFNPASGANSPVDGEVEKQPNSGLSDPFSEMRNDSTGTSAYTNFFIQAALRLGPTGGTGFDYLARGVMCFNTASLPDDAIITAATIRMYSMGAPATGLGSDSMHICSVALANTNNVVVGDYDAFGTTSFGSLAFGSIGSGNTTFTLNSSGRAHINKTGVSQFGLRLGWDLNGSYTGGVTTAGAEAGGGFVDTDLVGSVPGSSAPLLTVTYSLATNSTRSAHTVGSALANASRGAKLTGIGLPADSDRAAHTVGSIEISSTRGAHLVGAPNGVDEHDAVLTGTASDDDTRSAHTVGILGADSTRPGKTAGVEFASSTRGARMLGSIYRPRRRPPEINVRVVTAPTGYARKSGM